MAFLRFTQTWNSIPDFRGCFNWCLGRHNSSPDEAKHVTEELDADSTSKRRHYSATENGSAYNYDDQETSSDSDDEVLRHYRQSMRKVPSKRSIHSTNSCGGSDGDGTQDQVARASLHDAERGHSSEVGAGAPLASSTPSSSSRSRGAGVGAEGAGGAAAARQSLIGERGVDVGDPASPDEGLSNQAFQADSPDAPPSHASSSEPAMSGYGDSTSADQEEHLFDVSDLQSREDAGLISKCGTLDVTFNYEGHKERMTVTVHQAREIPTKERGGANNSQVRLLLLPTKKTRHKTKIKPGADPVFDETFVFKVPVAEVTNMGLRLRLYGCERMRRERMIGENVIGFANVNLDTPTTHALVLEPRSNLSHGDSKFDVSSLSRSDSASSTQSMQHGGMPELLVGLSYNGTTGRLAVEAIKGSNFRNMAMNKPPDTYVKFTLMSPNGQEIARSKTSIRRGQPNPLYKETFMFQVALFQLPDVTLMVSVYNKRSMKRKEMVGWFSLGLNNSGEEELSHWTDMRQSKGEQVCRWHVLLES